MIGESSSGTSVECVNSREAILLELEKERARDKILAEELERFGVLKDHEMRPSSDIISLGNALGSKEDFICVVCRINAYSAGGLYEHYSGKEHRAKLAAMKADIITTDTTYDLLQRKLSGLKLKEPTQPTYDLLQRKLSSLKLGVPTQPPIEENFSCLVCQINATSRIDLKQHFRGRKHQEKLAATKANTSTPIITTYDLLQPSGLKPKAPAPLKEVFCCTVCHIDAKSARDLNAHLTGKKHRAKVAARKEDTIYDLSLAFCALLTEKPPGSKQKALAQRGKRDFSCTICGINATSKRDLNVHTSGRKHQAKVAAIKANISAIQQPSESKQKASTPLVPAAMKECFSCVVCHINASSAQSLYDHLSGKKHRAKVLAMKAST